MLAEDVRPNRLARAKLAALDLVRRARTDRLGLVAFAGAAFLECPLTLDDAAFSQSVDSLDTKSISQGGTAITEAIEEAQKAFKKESDNHKVLVLFTDGEDQDSDALATAEKAAKEGMIIFTIGIGTPEGELLPIRDERGRLDYIRDDQGNPVKSHLNEELLQQIARATKGFYLPLRGTKTMDIAFMTRASRRCPNRRTPPGCSSDITSASIGPWVLRWFCWCSKCSCRTGNESARKSNARVPAAIDHPGGNHRRS